MSDDALSDRRKELEEGFFKKENEKLLKKLKDEQQRKLDKAGISRVTGVTNDAVLERLVSLSLNVETIAAFALFPLVDVAWADGAVDAREKKAVLDAADQSGISAGSSAHALLGEWLQMKPAPALREAWFNYVQALCEKLAAPDRELLKNELLGRARMVAESAGGILGMGNKVSKAEAEVLAKLETAFQR